MSGKQKLLDGLCLQRAINIVFNEAVLSLSLSLYTSKNMPKGVYKYVRAAWISFASKKKKQKFISLVKREKRERITLLLETVNCINILQLGSD